MKKDKNIEYADPLLRSLYEKFTSYMNEDDVDLEINPESDTIVVQNNRAEWRTVGTMEDHSDIETLGYILAGIEEKTLDIEHPILDTQMPYDGSRIHIRLPHGNDAQATLSIRRHTKSLGNLSMLQKTGMFTKAQMKIMTDAVKEKRSIIISGETGSGKTTLLTALVNEIPTSERLLFIEDTREIFLDDKHTNRSELTTDQFVSGIEGVKSTLRENPSRIIYGEVRDEAAFALIDSWNTGHRGGLGTTHANSAADIRDRFITLCSQDESKKGFAEYAVDKALDIGIQILFDKNGKRYVSEILDFKKLKKKKK